MWGGEEEEEGRQTSCQNLWVTIKSHAAILQSLLFMVPASCVPSRDTWMLPFLPCGTVSPLQGHRASSPEPWVSSVMDLEQAQCFLHSQLPISAVNPFFLPFLQNSPPLTRAPFLLKGRKGTAKAVMCRLGLVSHLQKLPASECSAGPLWAWLRAPAWVLVLQGELNPWLGLYISVLSSLHS